MISYDTNTYLTGTPWTSYGYWKAGTGNHPTTTAGYDLPAYPTTLPASDVFPWAKASTPVTQYTDAMARLSNSFTAGSGAYNNSTGVITIPTNTNQLTNGAGFITGTVSHAHGNISYTGAIGTTTGLPIITTTSGVLTAGSFGTTAGTFAQGNDSRFSAQNLTTQSLTSPATWNASLGINAAMTVTGNSSITLTDLTAGTSGNLRVISTGVYDITLTVSPWTNKISSSVYKSANTLKTSGSYKLDVFSWWFDGSGWVFWNGTLGYN
jgi:hypothetical protein